MPKLKSLVRRRRALNEVLAPYPPQKQTRYISVEMLRVERAVLRRLKSVLCSIAPLNRKPFAIETS